MVQSKDSLDVVLIVLDEHGDERPRVQLTRSVIGLAESFHVVEAGGEIDRASLQAPDDAKPGCSITVTAFRVDGFVNIVLKFDDFGAPFGGGSEGGASNCTPS